jgi:hypothetical protein
LYSVDDRITRVLQNFFKKNAKISLLTHIQKIDL